MTTINIANRRICRSGDPFLIAEAGINHNGSLDLAFKMIEEAKSVGVDCVKFQTFKAEEFVGDPHQTYTYTSQGKEVTESMLEMFRRYEFSKNDWVAIKKKCADVDIAFLSTPQNITDLDLLLELGIEAIKVGSDDFTNLPLLKAYAKTGLPIIVSCGMASLAEVHQSLDSIGTYEGYPTILLLCTSQYPTPPVDTNLNKLRTLSNLFPELIIGFSDHTQGSIAAPIALGLGAVVFEKHFTLDHNLPGPDHWFSEDVADLGNWTKNIRTAHQMLGSSIIKPTGSEETMKVLARRSVVALRAIDPGQLLTTENVGLKRPGSGLPAALYDQILGTSAAKKLEKGDLLRLGDFR